MTLDELDTLILADTTDYLSPSSVKSFQRCQAQWYLKKIEGLTERPNGNLVFGSAFDSAIGSYFDSRLAGQDPSVAAVQTLFADQFGERGKDVGWSTEKAKPADLATLGTRMVETFIADLGSKLQPVAPTQQHVEIDMGDFRVHGYLDAILEDEGKNRIVADVKTSGRRYDANEITRSIQATVYTAGTGIDEFAFLVGVKNKTPVTQLMQSPISAEKRDGDLAEIRRVREHMRMVGSGQVEPILSRSNTMVCSQRACSLWRECQSRFGGVVAD